MYLIKRKQRIDNKGITLIALAITVIILLILAGITIGTLKGNNGIIKETKKAKEETEIDSEKEIVELSVIQAMEKNRQENITQNELKTKLDNNTGKNNTEVIKDSDNLVVKFIKSDRYYEVSADGNVSDPIIKIVDNYTGDLTKGEKCDGSITSPFEINCIEDLVVFSIMANGGNTDLGISGNNFSNQYIILNRTLDFNSIFSYSDYTTTKYGDLNADGVIEDIKTELTKENEAGIGFQQIAQSYYNPFCGVFNGKNNSIRNIYEKNDSGLGLFGTISNATICNLKVTGRMTCQEGANKAGGIVNSVRADSKIINCISDIELEGNGSTGGIVGWASSVEITNCANLNTISGKTADAGGPVGGIIGTCESGVCGIYNSYNIGKINTKGPSAAGIIGATNSNVEIINVYNKGENIENGRFGRGGILGSNRTVVGNGNPIINNAYNFGRVIEKQINWMYGAGAICGYPSDSSTLDIKNTYYNKETCSVAVGNREDNLYGVTAVEKINNEDMIKNFNEYIDSNESKTSEWKHWNIGEDGQPVFE